MLSSTYRFHSRGGIKYTYQKGKTLRSAQISLVYADNSRKRQRFSVVISKKVLKSAVSRNRIRRRVYEAIRLELHNFSAHKDCIFIIHSPQLAILPFAELQQLISRLLQKTIATK